MRIPHLFFAALAISMLITQATLAHPKGEPMPQSTVTIQNPILFVTQVPIPADFATIGSVFANHLPYMSRVGRGGDLWIRYPDGTLKNLTEAAGYGTIGMQGENAIAVRDPSVHWDGEKAIFSMVVGAPTEQYFAPETRWQLYEITGLGADDVPVITKVANQPLDYNNISPIYGTDDRIIFTSDRPRNGAAHLYPQLDEYESTPVVTGIWRLDPTSGELVLLNHAPSGDFTPIIDSFGRVIFTQWDHMQQDQQADADRDAVPDQRTDYGTFNYSSEAADATMLYDVRTEVFPEPRGGLNGLHGGLLMNGHRFNHFIPWQMTEDGTEVETLNHIGRHELHDYLAASVGNVNNVVEYYGQLPRFNQNSITTMLQVKEALSNPGTYVGTNAPEFGTHAAGQVVTINGAPSENPSRMQVTYITHPETANYGEDAGTFHSGLYRDPLPLHDGTLLAVHTADTIADVNVGNRENPRSHYEFRIKVLIDGADSYKVAGESITGGITKHVSYWDPDVLVTYSGELWELQPVEVRARTRPERLHISLPEVEQQIFEESGVELSVLKSYLIEQGLALIVSRDVTTRDDLDRQQPFNLRVVNSSGEPIGAQSVGANRNGGSPDAVYDVAYMQIFQGDQIRGYELYQPDDKPRAGRRVIAQPLHEPVALEASLIAESGPTGSIQIAADGSVAAFVPARRALSWQLTDTEGNGIVRERNWLSFQPGEVRVCASCHGLNEFDQAGRDAPTNPPEALRTLLLDWQARQGSVTVTPTPDGIVSPQPSATPTPSDGTIIIPDNPHTIYLPQVIR